MTGADFVESDPRSAEHLSLNYGNNVLECFYQRLDKLGEGTFGTVYKAQDLQTKEYVALKRTIASVVVFFYL